MQIKSRILSYAWKLNDISNLLPKFEIHTYYQKQCPHKSVSS